MFMPSASERSAAPFASQQFVVSASGVSPRGHQLLVLLFTLAGAALRLLHLGAKSLWLDEPASVAIARLPWPQFKGMWWYGEAGYQGAYFLLMRGWLHLGQSEAWIRLPSAIFAIGPIPLIYIVARRLAGGRAALASAALLAFSPTHVYYSQEARGYTLAILLVLAAAWFLVRAVEADRERDWLLWTLCAALAFYTHFFSSLVLLAQACSLLVLRDPARWRRMFLHGCLLLALAAPGLTFVLRVPAHTTSFPWMPQATPKQVLHLALFFGGAGEKLVLSAILWIAAAIAIWRDRKRTSEIFWHGALLISWAVMPVLLMALISLYNPVFVQRYMIFCLPATIMLAGCGMIALPKHHLGLWLVLALCVSSIVNVFMGYRKPREDWRNATAAVLASAHPCDAVAIYPNFARPGFDYYYDLRRSSAPALHVFGGFYDTGKDDREFEQALYRDPSAFSHVWIMLRDGSPGRDYSPAIAARLQTIFGPPRSQKFPGITVLEFSH
ncbi:MAG: glycosyltransferase family 39 protein [Candidatus Korobacteraceae bacterium]|jgi:mannosyltransferase